MYTPLTSTTPSTAFSSKILILPSISKGNVPQLACDLLIASLGLKQTGFLDAKYLVPVVGGREGGEKGISTPLEVFSSDTSGVVVVQQRSPVLKVFKEEFVQALLKWIQDSNFKTVVMLAGVDTTNRSDAQMHTPSYYYIPRNSASPPKELMTALEAVQLQQFTSPPVPSYLQSDDLSSYSNTKDSSSDIPFIPGGGLTRRVLNTLGESWKIPFVVLLQFVFEGDNRGDAGMMVALINRLLDLKLERIKEPGSWKRGLFGSNHDGSLFG
ncbi:hypothetical protein CPB86DRAFT_757524 [Serendipita vermifera]|nr:hypothetical protein CPB86DRAFT_757524 [Serendipita vermifera]